MSELPEQDKLKETSVFSKSAVERCVMLHCGCGDKFSRPFHFIDKYNKYEMELSNLSRFYKRKLTMCDKCINKEVEKALNNLPKIIKALAT